MGRRSTIDTLPPEVKAAVLNYIRSHRHFTLDAMLADLKEQGFVQLSRSALGRFLPKFDSRNELCANPGEGTIVTIVERGTGEVRVVKSSVSGFALEALIAQADLSSILS